MPITRRSFFRSAASLAAAALPMMGIVAAVASPKPQQLRGFWLRWTADSFPPDTDAFVITVNRSYVEGEPEGHKAPTETSVVRYGGPGGYAWFLSCPLPARSISFAVQARDSAGNLGLRAVVILGTSS